MLAVAWISAGHWAHLPNCLPNFWGGGGGGPATNKAHALRSYTGRQPGCLPFGEHICPPTKSE